MEFFTLVWPFLIEWWPFIAVVFILWYLGQEIKKKAPPADKSWFWRLYWMTLSFHPVIAGVVLGYLGLPVPASVNALGAHSASLYYAAAGVLSVKWHDIWRNYNKYKKKKDE